jgi:hypothetical protein
MQLFSCLFYAPNLKHSFHSSRAGASSGRGQNQDGGGAVLRTLPALLATTGRRSEGACCPLPRRLSSAQLQSAPEGGSQAEDAREEGSPPRAEACGRKRYCRRGRFFNLLPLVGLALLLSPLPQMQS